ncbi:protein-cysteine S-palmitoyltransferase [Aureococcus anophagefferens]|nr:protein-cysteine S-palmitoyltransferase [Aureococcus anophagefferens]
MASASPVAGVVVSAAAAAMDRAVSAAQYGRHDDVWAAINNRLAIVDELLRRGVDVDGHGGVLDETAMQWATRHGHVGVVCRLREAGGDATHRGNEGGAAVHLACRYQQGAGPARAVAAALALRLPAKTEDSDGDGDDARLLDGAERGGDAVKHAVVPLGDSGAPGGARRQLATPRAPSSASSCCRPPRRSGAGSSASRPWPSSSPRPSASRRRGAGATATAAGRVRRRDRGVVLHRGHPGRRRRAADGRLPFLLACLLGNFFAAVFAEPGVVGGSADARVAAIVDLARRDALVEGALCPSCLVKRPDRSKHDPTLGRCVRRFDHYCPYVANVVGERNYRAFYLFLAFVVATIGLHLLLLLPSLRLCGLDARDGPRTETGKVCALHGDNALELVGTFFAVLHLIWVSCMLLMHSTLVCHDQTTCESIRGVGVGHPDNPPSCRNCRRSLCADGAAAVDDAAAEVELQPRA